MASRRKQDDNNLEILRDLITQKGNRYCFDCKQRGPTYVNTTIGSFVCSKCSGMLRGLTPPHRVKSISMATFSPEEMEFIKQRGNDYCKRTWTGIYEEQSDDRSGSRDEQTIKELMVEKYEKKWYYIEPVEGNGNTNVTIIKPLNRLNNNNGSVKGPSASTMSLISILPQAESWSNSKPHKVQNVVPKNVFQALDNANNFQAAANPQFPVDFSNANIYNSNQLNNNMTVSSSYTIVNDNKSASVTNDRYAALADLDSAVRQNNLQRHDNQVLEGNRNPFHTPMSAEPNVNSKNPFYNGAWNTNSTQSHANPFSTAPSFSPLGTRPSPSKNPFL